MSDTTFEAPFEIEGGVIHTHSKITIADEGPRAAIERTATLPGQDDTFTFGVHDQFAEHYGVERGQYPSRATTNDVFTTALATCLSGTYALVLEARGVPVTSKEFEAHATAEIGPAETGGGWLVRRVHVVFKLNLPEEYHDTARRVHRFFHRECWLSQTLKGSRCEITSELDFG